MTARGLLLAVSLGGMELSWLYAWATFLTTSLLHEPFPLPEAAASFALAALLTRFCLGRGWRVIAVLGVQCAGFLPCLWRVSGVFGAWAGSFAARVSPDAFNATMGASEWLVAVLVVFWGALFWVGGVHLGRRPPEYLTVCQRWDLGLGALFLLAVVGCAASAGGGPPLPPDVARSFFSFFFFGLLAVALARMGPGEGVVYSSGFRNLGAVLSVAVSVLLLGGGAVPLALPYLRTAARAGLRLLAPVSRPVRAAASALFDWLLGPDSAATGAWVAKKKVAAASSTWGLGGWLLGLGELLARCVEVLLGLAVLAMLVAIVYFGVRGLFERTGLDPSEQGRSGRRSLADALRRLTKAVARAFRRRRSGARLFGSLAAWGRRTGLRRGAAETPCEYGVRLCAHLHGVRGDVDVIVGAYNDEAYGDVLLDERRVADGRRALRRLRSPALVPARLRTRFSPAAGRRVSPRGQSRTS